MTDSPFEEGLPETSPELPDGMIIGNPDQFGRLVDRATATGQFLPYGYPIVKDDAPPENIRRPYSPQPIHEVTPPTGWLSTGVQHALDHLSGPPAPIEQDNPYDQRLLDKAAERFKLLGPASDDPVGKQE